MSHRIPIQIKYMKQIRKLYDENITNTMNKNIKLAELTKMNEKHITANFTKKEKEQYNVLLDSVRDYNSRIEKNNDKIDRLDELLEEELDKTGSLDFTKGGKKRKPKKQTRKKQKGGVAPDRNRRSNRNRRNFLSIPASPDESRNRTHEHEGDDEFTTRLTQSSRSFSPNILHRSTPSESSDASDDNIIPPLESVNSSETESEPEPENETLDNQYENLIRNYVSLVLDNLNVSQERTINMVEQAVRSFMTILNIINRDIPVENSMFETFENNLYSIMLPLSTPDRMNLSITLTQTSRRYIHNWEGNISEQQRNDLGRVLSLINRFRLEQLRNEYVVPDNTVRRPREVGGKKKKTRRRRVKKII
jgi:hypothetical protein